MWPIAACTIFHRHSGGRRVVRIRHGQGGRALLCWLSFLCVAASSCAIHGLDFRQDKRINILDPPSLSTVTVPFTVRWTAKDFSYGPNTIQGGNNYFAILVDHPPMPPGGSLRDLGDNACKETPGCPDLNWLQQHDMYLSASTSISIGSLPHTLPASTPAGTKESHAIVIVLMNGTNHRIGESAWFVNFFRLTAGVGN